MRPLPATSLMAAAWLAAAPAAADNARYILQAGAFGASGDADHSAALDPGHLPDHHADKQ